jgi:hypothetical protein
LDKIKENGLCEAKGKNCLKRKFDVVKGRTCDDKNPAFQAVVGSGTLTVSCASLAYGYENLTFQVSYYVRTKERQIEMHLLYDKIPSGKIFVMHVVKRV